MRGRRTISNRFTIELPKELVCELNAIYPDFTTNKKNFIAEALKEKIDRYLKERIDELLAESYKESYEEDKALAKEYESVDLEGWE